MNYITCPKGVLSNDFNQIIAIHQQLIKDHSKAIPNAQDLAEGSNMSTQKFRTLFQKIFNDSYYNYYQNMRLEYAKSLLLDNKFTIVQIAYKVGFQHSQNFARAFLRYSGMTAKEFRNKHLK